MNYETYKAREIRKEELENLLSIVKEVLSSHAKKDLNIALLKMKRQVERLDKLPPPAENNSHS